MLHYVQHDGIFPKPNYAKIENTFDGQYILELRNKFFFFTLYKTNTNAREDLY